ncbi:PolC-type DNA polymerase III [Mycoplasma zalophidermidis]|uniref:DNA polymerase III PolC-type n=1 Tax=Mycoplasma zalophidermidis TaxID=398174 RepID=A0ABS6DQU1_9MOLU|nr:PolC-type DNA polymerase III [Mycoplasma zalophidermidis]MBU4689495.1 PolC-type DNA polymerase III [Mycoplasma zalophidermidis]MBU4693373.1 PolC-type DNA polymerase III [Mycoplasma zalophidermidis]MCR8966329.1 PolC-type DNA polymerase III [Mycoplasma zalophidermidis]
MNESNIRFKKFCDSIGFKIPDNLIKTELEVTKYETDIDQISVNINFRDEINPEDFFALLTAIRANKIYKVFITFSFDLLQYKHTNLVKFIEYIIATKSKYSKLKVFDWNRELIGLDGSNFEVTTISEERFNEFKDLVDQLSNSLNKYGYKNLNLKLIYQSLVLKELDASNRDNDLLAQEQFLKLMNSKPVQSKSSDSKPSKKWSRKQYQDVEIINIKHLPEKTNITITGEIYASDLIVTKNKKYIYSFSITDHTDAINAKWFRDDALDEDILNKDLKNGNFIKLFGTTAYQTFGKPEWFIYIDSFEKAESIYKKRVDTASEDQKRIELHVSSKLNTMDGLFNPPDIISKAEEFGMPAVAICDLDAVQGYPNFYQKARKSKVKGLYAASFSVFHKNPIIFYGDVPSGKITDHSYVSFDIETTGLSPKFHELIEYGSYVINVNKIAPQPTQFLVKPKEKIKPYTTQLTGITQKDIDSTGLDCKVALQKIYDDLNGKIALAHNAKFDYNFIKEQFRLNNMEFPNVVVIDTLAVSRLIFSERKKHSLGDLAANLGVNYNPNVAHRGDYDAKVLADIWLEMMHTMSTKNIFTFQDLLEFKPENEFKDRFPYAFTSLVRNQLGLKKQFAMVSDCLTKNYSYGPRTFYEDIKPDPDLLFGSGTLKSKLIDDYFYASRSQFLEEIKRYDYIEIPAPQVFKHWVDMEFITKDQLHDGLKDIILTAKEYNKIPVATGDVRYSDKADKKAFEILVYAKGIGAARHYLYNYGRAKEGTLTIPDQEFLTTNEMLNQFEFLGDEDLIKEIVITNSRRIADMCEEVVVIKDKLYTPKFDDSSRKLRELVYQNAKLKYGDNLPEIVDQRIKAELTPIIEYGFDVIYWISHRLVKKSLDEGYVVGSRGSVGSSLVATLSEISEVNPLPPYYLCNKCKFFELANVPGITSAYDLKNKKCPNCEIDMERDGHNIAFETFLGFKADKVPDIDLNFSGEFQGEVHNETRRLFGQTHTLRAGTISTVAPKTGFGYVKNFIEETHTDYSDAYAMYLATKIDGVKRTTGQHPGGIIIIPTEYDVYDFTPINYPADDTNSTWFTTHFEYKAIHDNVLKLDLLGHDNPTIIKMLETYTGLRIADIPKNDPEIVKVFNSTDPLGIKPSDIGGEATGAIGLPEFGTQFVRQMLLQAQPKSFADLVSISGLSHGTNVWIGNNQDLIMKEGFRLPDIFCCRDDILAKLVAEGVPNRYAFNIMEKVRKGKGLTPEEQAELRKYNVPEWQIDSMLKIAYMFPKAHAVAYVLMAWWIGWFKINQPLAFYASYFATHAKAVDVESMVDVRNGKKAHNKLVQLQSVNRKELDNKSIDLMPTLEVVRELYARGLYIANIDIERSQAHEWVIDNDEKCLIPPFKSLDGLGDSVAESIVNARTEKSFSSIQDFITRAKVNKTLVEKMEKMGIFAKLDETDQMRLF